MKVLVACEESQRVCTAFRKKGHEAYSCDILSCSGGHPEWHIKSDVIPLLNGNCSFITMNGDYHVINSFWDFIIAHPPCTYLSSVGNRSFSEKCNSSDKIALRLQKRFEALDFVITIWNSSCDKIVIENPVGYLNTHWMKPTQIIHPYYFAANVEDVDNYVLKRTCLWLKGVQKLERTTFLNKPEPLYYRYDGKAVHWCEGLKSGSVNKSILRSKTFPGVANAMASQWNF